MFFRLVQATTEERQAPLATKPLAIAGAVAFGEDQELLWDMATDMET